MPRSSQRSAVRSHTSAPLPQPAYSQAFLSHTSAFIPPPPQHATQAPSTAPYPTYNGYMPFSSNNGYHPQMNFSLPSLPPGQQQQVPLTTPASQLYTSSCPTMGHAPAVAAPFAPLEAPSAASSSSSAPASYSEYQHQQPPPSPPGNTQVTFSFTAPRSPSWTSAQDAALLASVKKRGTRWTQVVVDVNRAAGTTRTIASVKGRYNRLQEMMTVLPASAPPSASAPAAPLPASASSQSSYAAAPSVPASSSWSSSSATAAAWAGEPKGKKLRHTSGQVNDEQQNCQGSARETVKAAAPERPVRASTAARGRSGPSKVKPVADAAETSMAKQATADPPQTQRQSQHQPNAPPSSRAHIPGDREPWTGKEDEVLKELRPKVKTLKDLYPGYCQAFPGTTRTLAAVTVRASIVTSKSSVQPVESGKDLCGRRSSRSSGRGNQASSQAAVAPQDLVATTATAAQPDMSQQAHGTMAAPGASAAPSSTTMQPMARSKRIAKAPARDPRILSLALP